MKREELLKSKEYWLTRIQISLFNEVDFFLKNNNLTRSQFAKKLGVSKGYISQILNGESDHKISKLVELSLAINLAPFISFENLDRHIERDKEEIARVNGEVIELCETVLLCHGYMIGRPKINVDNSTFQNTGKDWSKVDFTYKDSEKSVIKELKVS